MCEILLTEPLLYFDFPKTRIRDLNFVNKLMTKTFFTINPSYKTNFTRNDLYSDQCVNVSPYFQPVSTLDYSG